MMTLEQTLQMIREELAKKDDGKDWEDIFQPPPSNKDQKFKVSQDEPNCWSVHH